MAAARIEVIDVSKRYLLGEHHGAHGTLRDSLADAARRLRRGDATRERREIWSLRDVSVAVGEGEALGVIGRNGAGKSTLLKLVTRITEPTSGRTRTRGRVGSLLEVGTGFHQELTGRENVFLNGAILGMRRRQIERRFEEIVDFAGVEGFLDTPVKRYSSGMAMRLAFSVAAHLDTEIIVVDEVLAVGDRAFQRKCLSRMGTLEREGRTVLFVSHNLDAISRLCRTSLWLDGGRVSRHGPTAEVIDAYVAAGVERTERRVFPEVPDAAVQLLSVAIVDESGAPCSSLSREEPFEIEVRFVVREHVPGLDLAVFIEDFRNVRVLDEAWSDTVAGERGGPGEYVARLLVPPILPVGDFQVGVWMGSAYDHLVFEEGVLGFRLDGDVPRWADRVVQLGLPWRVDQVGDAVPTTGPD